MDNGMITNNGILTDNKMLMDNKMLTDNKPIGEMINLFVSSLELILQVDQLPQVVRVHVLDAARADLNLGDGDQDLVPDDLHLGCVLLRGTLQRMGQVMQSNKSCP